MLRCPMLFPEPGTGSPAGWGRAGAQVPRHTGSVLGPWELLLEPPHRLTQSWTLLGAKALALGGGTGEGWAAGG